MSQVISCTNNFRNKFFIKKIHINNLRKMRKNFFNS